MRPEIYYLLRVAPLLLILAMGAALVGLLLAWILWFRGTSTSRRLRQETEAMREQIIRARQEAK